MTNGNGGAWKAIALALIGVIAVIGTFEIVQAVNRANDLGQLLREQQAALHRQAVTIEGLRGQIGTIRDQLRAMTESLDALRSASETLSGRVHGNSSMLGKLRVQQERWIEQLRPARQPPNAAGP